MPQTSASAAGASPPSAGSISAPAKRRIDAAGRVVAPGFIDMLGQSELTILVDPKVPSKVFQGITTEITGEGESVAPVNDAIARENAKAYEHYGIKRDWTDFAGYFAHLERQGIGINLASYVGATTVREMVIGYGDRAATPAELEQMQGLVAQAMRQGAVGVSSALEYAPAPYASTEELIALARTAAEYGGIYATHMRSEQEAIMTSLEETIRIGREAHIPVEIWHLKAGGVKNFGLMPEIVARIERARAAGVDIAADTYAYPAWFNELSAFIPPWAHDGGKAKLIERLKDPAARGAHQERARHSRHRLGQRMAVGCRARSRPDRDRHESKTARHPGQDASPTSRRRAAPIRWIRCSTF